MHTLTPAPSHAVANTTSAKDSIHRERTISEELADAEAQVATVENERWLYDEAKAVPRRTFDLDERRRMKAQLISQACGLDQHDAPLYPASDVEAWLRLPETDGYAAPNIGASLIVKLSRVEVVPNARVRARYLELKAEAASADPDDGSVQTPSAIASRLGMRNSELERALGVVPNPPGSGDSLPTLRLFLPYEVAVRVADALGMTYHEAGL